MIRWLTPWWAILTLCLMVAVRESDPSFLESVRLRYFDTLVTSGPAVATQIHTIQIDDQTITRYGQYPLNRSVYAEYIQQLYAHGAGLVISTILMPDPDPHHGDELFAKTMDRYPVLLVNAPAKEQKNVPRYPGSVVLNPEYLTQLITYPGMLSNIPLLETAAAGVGTIHTLPELDGVVRRMPLVASAQGVLYPSVPLETLRLLANDTTIQVKLFSGGIEKLRIPQFGPIATDELGRVWIDWTQTAQTHSFLDPIPDLNGAIVILGVTATGVANPVPTSLGSVWPHDVQAAVIGTLINGISIQRPDWAMGLELSLLCLGGLLIIALSRWTYVGLGFTVLLILSAPAFTYWFYTKEKWLLDVTMLDAGFILIALHAYGVKFLSEFLQKQQIKKQFGTYLSPAMVEKLQQNPALLRLGGERRELSIMFTDVRGFTTISEHYGENVEGLTQIMNRYMTAMTETILVQQGTLDKYIGDAQMAFWNAPLNDADHAYHAVLTAQTMLHDLDRFNEEIAAEGVPPFGMGIGINTGSVIVGNMGSTQRFDYTCLGDAVNLASRLEGQSKSYGVKLILGPQTAEIVKSRISVTELDCLAVKGKKQGVHIYTVAEHDTVHQQFLDLYYSGEWKKALHLADGLSQSNPTLKEYYTIMTQRLSAGCPSNWTGVYVATSK
jgi:adenylate cyclase